MSSNVIKCHTKDRKQWETEGEKEIKGKRIENKSKA